MAARVCNPTLTHVGSYGGVPILSMSPNDSDEHHVIRRSSHKKKRKGKSRLADNEATESQQTLDSSRTESVRSKPSLASFGKSRRRLRDKSRSSLTLGEELDGQEENTFGARINRVDSDPSTTGLPLLNNSSASSISTTIDGDGDGDGDGNRDDDDESNDSNEGSEDGSLHDVKGNPLDNSPYAQVRASVAASDNTSLSIDTPRMWFLSILFSMAGSSTNLFFSLRYPSVSLTPIIALLLVHPLGLFWDQALKRPHDPEEVFVNGSLQKRAYTSLTPQPTSTWSRSIRLWLAQGRWNEKEHCCVYVSSNVSFGFAFATDVGGST